ncbi:MAG: polysaccharide biosynthesis tyrosine autokinase, partial [Lentimicrobiaceae bacterium]|nr:polysaccharide biosynthesis tyrosine autokinase [Lentimicrobiaceae bacterium]
MAMENFEGIQQHEESIDIKALFFKFISHWYLFALTLFVAVIVAFMFNKYTSPVYEVNTTVLVKDEKGALDPSSMLGGLGLSNNQQNVENEIGILRSFSLTYRAIKDLDFEISYFIDEGLISTELYHTSPFEVIMDTSIPQTVGQKFNVRILSSSEYSIELNGELLNKYNFSTKENVGDAVESGKWKGTFRFGELIENEYGSFKIILNDRFDSEKDFESSYYFIFNDYLSLTKRFRGFEIEPINREASILQIKLENNNTKKAVNFLNMLTKVYLQRGLDQKNMIASNTIRFIDGQLDVISDTLRAAETDLQTFQSDNEVMDLSFQAQQVFTYIEELQKQKAEMVVKSKYYNNLRNYIQKNSQDIDQLVAPSAMGIDDPVLNALVGQLIELYSKKSELLLTGTDRNPSVISINTQIRSTQNAILGNIGNIIENSNEVLADIDNRIDKITRKASNLPVTQRELINFQRQFDIANNIYTYLLEKRSEAQITKASNLPDNEIIDVAREELSSQVFPKKSLNYVIALILGLVIPVVYVLGKDYFNDSIIEKKDVESATSFPIIGQLLHSTKDSQLVVLDSPKSSVSEAFRSLRTNLQYLAKGKDKITIMVTADMVSAGKTYVSINMASIYAQYGKKTVLLGFDLRKPKIYQDFGLNNNVGLTTYLINKANLDDIIQSSGKNEHLDIIMSGPIPPNPAELIASDRNAELFRELRERYDYIIIDTPPVGLVTDAYLLMQHTDVNIFLVRQAVTHKKVFASIIKDIEDRGMKMAIVINDIKLSGGGYGYGYG